MNYFYQGDPMRISISKDNTYGFTPVEVNTVSELVKAVTNNKWSCSVFKDGHRNLKNFISADCIAFDIDNEDSDVTIEQAQEIFGGYKNLILPTKSHRQLKNGAVKDRYRVIIPFDKTVTDPDEYRGAWLKLYEKFNFTDAQCKDPSRYWEPSTRLEYNNWNTGEPAIGVKIERSVTPVQVNTEIKGKLLTQTISFIFGGAKAGLWNESLHHAALDLRSQGYTIEEAYDLLAFPCRSSIGNEGQLDSNDIATIESAYKADVYHDKRGAVNAFDFQKVGDILKTSTHIDWLVDNLLTDGGMSIIAGAPKSGKSTIIRQLGKEIAQGGEFLGRKCKQGTVLYLALEEQKALLSQQLKQLGVKQDDPFFIHCGAVMSPDKHKDLSDFVLQQKPALVVIDTFILFAAGKDINNYNDMYEVLSYFRDLAREAGCHITFVHHQNKSDRQGTNSIMGSSAIHGAVDNAIVFCNVNGIRRVTTSQRGGIPFDNDPLEFDAKTQTYGLGRKEEF